MRASATVRAAVLAATVPLSVAAGWVLAAPASAQIRDAGDDPGEQLTALQNLLLYVVAPVGLFLLIALLVMAPSIARGPRYRPGLTWWAEPVWFGGPADAEVALAEVEPTRDGGSFSARW